MKASWCVALALLAASQAAAAAATLPASSLSSNGASLRVESAAIDWPTHDLPAASLGFRLEAKEVLAETDHGEYVRVGATAIGTTPPATTTQLHHDTTWSGMNWGAEASLFVVSADAVLATPQASAVLSVPRLACRPQTEFIAGARDLPCADASQALEVRLEDGALSLAGTFDVYLWGWQGTARAANETSTYWTGEQSGATQPAMAGPSQRQFLVLHVRDGLLELAIPPGHPATLLGHRVELEAAAVQLLGAEVAWVRDASLVATRQGPALSVLFQSGVADGPAGRDFAAAPADPGGIAPAWMAVALAPLAFVGARIDARSKLRHAADSLALGNGLAAHRHARAARRYPWARREAQTLAVIALLRSGSLQQAERELAAADRVTEATRAFLAAYLLASRSHVARARQALARSIQLDPAYRGEALQHPVLRALVPDLETGDVT